MAIFDKEYMEAIHGAMRGDHKQQAAKPAPPTCTKCGDTGMVYDSVLPHVMTVKPCDACRKPEEPRSFSDLIDNAIFLMEKMKSCER